MKINDILFEDHTEHDFDWVRENCSEALNRLTNGHVIYRGDRLFKLEKGKVIVMTPRTKPREAAYANYNLHNDIINKSKAFSSFPKREIIMTTDKHRANEFGELLLCLPVDGAIIGIVPDDDIFTGFLDIPDPLNIMYAGLEFEFLTLVSDYTKNDFYSMDSSNNVFKDIVSNAPPEFIGTLLNILENEIDVDSELAPYTKVLSQCVKDGNAHALFELFNPRGWEVTNISNFHSEPHREIWTDRPVALIRPSVLDDLL